MPQVTLRYAGREIAMRQGENFVGRSVECQLRFNDASISRRHLRIMCTERGAFIENLSLTNGSKLNGETLLQLQELSDGDIIELGNRALRVTIDLQARAPTSPTMNAFKAADLASSNHLTNENDEFDGGPLQPIDAPSLVSRLCETALRNCPKCRAQIARKQSNCSGCGYQWPTANPAMPTQQILIQDYSKRKASRFAVRCPIIYYSDFLTLDCTARDVGSDGMFIASEVLDPVGTLCQITALPDGWPALQFQAKVCHASTEIIHGRPAGFGVQFTPPSDAMDAWLLSLAANTKL